MTLQEFKAWLEGYSAGFMDGVPNAEQWAAVAEKLRNVQPIRLDGPVTPFPITYYPPTRWIKESSPLDPVPYWQNPVVTC